MRILISVAALFIASSSTAIAQSGVLQLVCPIDGERFTYQKPPPLSSRETYLDQRPLDPAFPWPQAKCPGNGFVIYRTNLPRNRIAKLREFIATEEYQRLRQSQTTHYLEAVMRRHLRDSQYAVAWALLQATWQVSDDPIQYKKYAEEALAAYDAIPVNSLPEIRHRILKRMISGELARRLRQFDSAEERFLEMRDSAELSKPFYQRIVEFQLKLVRAKDSRPHRIPY